MKRIHVQRNFCITKYAVRDTGKKTHGPEELVLQVRTVAQVKRKR